MITRFAITRYTQLSKSRPFGAKKEWDRKNYTKNSSENLVSITGSMKLLLLKSAELLEVPPKVQYNHVAICVKFALSYPCLLKADSA